LDSQLYFLFALPVVAFLYASIGHGGASGYLALMALFSFATKDMKFIALVLNLFVSGIGFYFFWKKGFFRWNLFWPFAISSIPAAYLGGLWHVNMTSYKYLLSAFLFFAVSKMMIDYNKVQKDLKPVKLELALAIGAIIGLMSGLIGIGGGIILSPVILLLGWGRMKETAAVSALFIFVNSLSGLIGLMSYNTIQISVGWIGIVICVAVFGGLLGAWWGSSILNNKVLKMLLAIVLGMAAVKLVLL
jgi:uncharacterized membrane protein YfcA